MHGKPELSEPLRLVKRSFCSILSIQTIWPVSISQNRNVNNFSMEYLSLEGQPIKQLSKIDDRRLF